MEDMAIQPSADILAMFAVRLVAPLGGRLNQHWFVDSGRERRVLRRWSSSVDAASISYELRLLEAIAARGWPVAPTIAGPVEREGYAWSLFPLLPGAPVAEKYSLAEQQARGRLLAAFHADLAQLQGFGQRGTWRRCEAILGDPALDDILAANERQQPEEVRILRWHLHRARERIAGLQLHERPGTIIHGDFTPWNLHFNNGQLSGILDFELAHWDHRIADFALSWRGKYDEVIHGYTSVSPLEPEEWALLTPMWWAWLIEGACQYLAAGGRDDGWTIKQLLRRSPLMGPDATEFR